jgi:hypothetical protein
MRLNTRSMQCNVGCRLAKTQVTLVGRLAQLFLVELAYSSYPKIFPLLDCKHSASKWTPSVSIAIKNTSRENSFHPQLIFNHVFYRSSLRNILSTSFQTSHLRRIRRVPRRSSARLWSATPDSSPFGHCATFTIEPDCRL